MENYKKIDLPLDAFPNYNLSSVIYSIQSLGYNVTNIMFNEGPPQSEEDYRLVSITFKIRNLPIINPVLGEDLTTELGSAQITIFAVESIHPDTYYIEDIVASNFVVDSLIPELNTNTHSYKSYALDSTLFALLKTYIFVSSPKVEENSLLSTN
jgi:hypothetical protein